MNSRLIGQLCAIDAAADQRATQSQLLHRVFQLRGREIRMLQGNRCEADEPVGLCRADFGELFVLQLDDLSGEVGLGLLPKDRVYAQRLDVDALLVHGLDAFRRDHQRWLLNFQSHQSIRLGDMAVGVHIDGANTFSGDDDFASSLRRLRKGRAHAPDDPEPSKRPGSVME